MHDADVHLAGRYCSAMLTSRMRSDLFKRRRRAGSGYFDLSGGELDEAPRHRGCCAVEKFV